MGIIQKSDMGAGGQVIPVPERLSGAACAACHLRGRALCRLVEGHAGHGAHPPRLRRFESDATIFERGQRRRPTGVLRRGYLRQESLTRDGDRTLLGLMAPGDLVGWMPDFPGPFTLEAATDAEICVFDARTVRRLIDEDAGVRKLDWDTMRAMRELDTCVTAGGQTHASDGMACLLVTTAEKAKEQAEIAAAQASSVESAEASSASSPSWGR